MQPIIGNASLLKALFSAYEENRLAGCYLIEGAKGTGKLTIVRYLACAMNCTHKSAGKPCLTCPDCKNILAGNHVDVHEVRPEEEGKRIPVAAIREWLQNTYILPSQSDWRIFILENSECMKKEAQNALLKSIEEPGQNTVFFLLTEDKTALLPTVRSRAVQLKTEPLSREIIYSTLLREGYEQERASQAALLASGSLGRARDLMGNEEIQKARDTVLQYFKALYRSDGFTKLSLILPPATVTRKELGIILPLFKLALRDLMVERYFDSSQGDFFSDESLRRELAAVIDPASCVKLYELCEELEEAAQVNVNLFSALSGFHLTAEGLTGSV